MAEAEPEPGAEAAERSSAAPESAVWLGEQPGVEQLPLAPPGTARASSRQPEVLEPGVTEPRQERSAAWR
jgi:hypothetical protein